MHSPLVSSCIFTCISATVHPYIMCVSVCLSDDSICRAASSPRSEPRQLSDRLCGRVNAMSCWTIWDGSVCDSRYGLSSWMIYLIFDDDLPHIRCCSHPHTHTQTHTDVCIKKDTHLAVGPVTVPPKRLPHLVLLPVLIATRVELRGSICGLWGNGKGGKVLCAVPSPAPASPISSLLCHLSHTAPDHHWVTQRGKILRKMPVCLMVGTHCTHLEIWWFNSNSYCMSQSFTIKSQSKQLMCSHRTVQSSSSHCAHKMVCSSSDLSIDDCQ